MISNDDFVGIIPAGGKAARLKKLPCSKEILPLMINDNDQIAVTSSFLIQYYKNAGIRNVYFVIREGKWDVPAYYRDGSDVDVNIGYLIMDKPYGAPFTIDQAYPFVKNSFVALGFPDILLQPESVFTTLKDKIMQTGADIVLGIFPVENYKKWDLIEFNQQGKIASIQIKKDRPDLTHAWAIAVWSPAFTEFLHTQLINYAKEFENNMDRNELYIGNIIQDAMIHDMNVDYVIFEGGKAIDTGTPEDLKKYLSR